MTKGDAMTRFTYMVAVAAWLVLAVGTASAAGGSRPDDRPTHGPGAIGLTETAASVRPNDRAIHGPGAFTSGTSSEIVRPDDRAWRGIGPAPTVEIVQSPSVSADGFDWADAGIGAAAAVGFGLLLAGASALVLRRQRATAFS
jgi:hypothetical protein